MGVIKLKKAGQEEVVEHVGEKVEIVDENVSVEETVAQNNEMENNTWDDPAVLSEDESKITENSRHYVLNNGTAKSVFTASAMNFYDEGEKKWKTIDNSLEEREDCYEAKFGKFKAQIAKAEQKKAVKISGNGLSVSWEYLGKKQQEVAANLSEEQMEKAAKPVALAVKKSVKGIAGIAKDGEAVYENIEDNTNLQYILQGNNVKENIIVQEKADEYKYLFALNTEGLTMRLSEDSKSIELCSETVNADGTKEEKVEFTIPSPYMYDAEGNQSEDVYYEIEEESDGRYVFAVVADSAWINEFYRVFPVTIDPQIVTTNAGYITKTVQYRYISTSSSGSWQTISSSYIKILRNSYQEYKTTLSISKGKMNFPELKISSVKLILKPSYIRSSGTCYIGNSSVLINDYKDKIFDITNSFRNGGDTFNITISTSYSSDIEFYDTPVIEIEFLTNEKSHPVMQSFDLAGGMNGNYNVATGDATIAFGDVSEADSRLGFGIAHIFKRSGDELYCGKNFRLNLNESLIKNTTSALDADYIYTDAYGDKHGFKDTYYYLDSNGKKQPITNKTTIEIDLDGDLSYSYGGKKYKAYKEQRTATGLTAITELEGYKYCKYVEQRTDEYKQLEAQKQSYLNTLNGIVLSYKSTGEIYAKLKDNLTKDKFETFINNAKNTNYILCAESEAINYRSLLAQQKSMGYQYTSMGLQVESMNTQKTYNEHLKGQNNSDESAKKYYTDTNSNLNKQINNINSQKTLLGVYDNQTGTQRDVVYDQIQLMLNNESQYIQQIEEYYKAYLNVEHQLSQMDMQMPVNYLSDGKIIKGFNCNGNLVVIFDQYENSMTIEYDDDGKIVKVYDGENKQIIFDYNPKGLLKSITDTRGRKTGYQYDSNDCLTGIVFANGKTVNLSYDSNYNIISITSSDKMQSMLTYSSCSLSKVATKSQVAGVAHGKPSSTTNSVSMSETTFTHTQTLTTVADINGNKKYYKIDETGNVTEYYEETNGKVVKAEKYEYVPYSKDNTNSAKRESLYAKGYSSFTSSDFTDGDYVNTSLDEFNNPSMKTTNVAKLSDGTKQQTTVTYEYDDDHRCVKEVSQVTVKKGSSTLKTNKQITQYRYNAAGNVVRKESYIDGEELTSGIDIEETEFNEKGRSAKSFTYNSLDSSSKFYTESEYAENGKTLAEYDETGEHKTEFEYVGDTEIVRTQKLPNGGKFSYGYDVNDTVTSITQSTEEGEENSTHTRYTCGEVTELVSGNNKVQYAYDYKRRLAKVDLNGVSNYVAYTYGDKISATVNGTSKTVNKVTATYVKRNSALAADVFETLSDLNGNTVQTKYNGTVQAEWVYSADNKLTAYSDKINNRTVAYTYDALDRVTTYAEKSGSTELVKETYGYDDYGSLLSKTITGQVSHTYTYSYKQDAAHTLESIACGTLKVIPKTDVNGRSIGKELYVSGTKKAEEIVAYRKVGDHATNMPSAVWFGNVINGNYVIRDNVKYAYDEMGNINKIYENGEMVVRYAYDKLSRLVREDNKAFGKTWVYAYDRCGNIISKREFDYTLRETDKLEELTSSDKLYSYNGDRLMGYGSETFVYDSMGNPTTYRGKAATWSKGRQLQSLGGTSFTYDSQGRRISKGNITFTYDSDGRIIKQSNGLEFIYDGAGVVGVKYNGTQYLYRKDAQGNVVALLDSNGNVVVKYSYDAWGNHGVEVLNSACATLANLNPFRYRSYYYDTETELYYLQTRYYDPEIGRFITIDGVEYIDPETINGLNLYAYCGNNPVMYTDPNGTAKWWQWVLLGIAALAAVALVVVGTVLSGGTLAILGGALAGAGSGFLIGAGGSIVSQGIASNWQNIDPMNALISGGIGAAVGAVTGTVGAYFGQLGAQAGTQLGYNLSKATIAGMKVGKAFEYLGGTKMIMGVGKAIGATAGTFVGGALSNELANNLFGIDPSISDNLKSSLDGLIQGWILDVIYKFFKWIR